MTNQNTNINDASSMADDEPRSIPLSFEDGKEAITVAAGTSRRRLGFGAMLFTGVAAIAVVSLFSMRAIGRASASTTPPSEAEALITTWLKDREGKSESKCDPLQPDTYNKFQIPREQLVKNPFILAGEEMVLRSAPATATKVESKSNSNSNDERTFVRSASWEQTAAAAAGTIRVQSAMVSSIAANSMAHINGQVLRVGETLSIDGANMMFTVKEVTPDGVVLRTYSDELQREALFKILVKRD